MRIRQVQQKHGRRRWTTSRLLTAANILVSMTGGCPTGMSWQASWIFRKVILLLLPGILLPMWLPIIIGHPALLLVMQEMPGGLTWATTVM